MAKRPMSEVVSVESDRDTLPRTVVLYLSCSHVKFFYQCRGTTEKVPHKVVCWACWKQGDEPSLSEA